MGAALRDKTSSSPQHPTTVNKPRRAVHCPPPPPPRARLNPSLYSSQHGKSVASSDTYINTRGPVSDPWPSSSVGIDTARYFRAVRRPNVTFPAVFRLHLHPAIWHEKHADWQKQQVYPEVMVIGVGADLSSSCGCTSSLDQAQTQRLAHSASRPDDKDHSAFPQFFIATCGVVHQSVQAER